MPPTRRQFLATLATGGAVGATAGRTRAQTSEYAAPADVTITFDKERLERYRPWLDIDHLDVRPYALYGHVAESPEYEYDIMVYAARYTHQDGVSPLAPPLTDSHFGDTEWLYTFVDNNGDVAEVVHTAYHWVANRATGPQVPIYAGTHPVAYVNNPYHHYTLNSSVTGEFVEVRDLTDPDDGLDAWLESGMDEDLAPGAVRDPAIMRTRDSWWRSGFDQFYAELFHDIIEPLPII